MLAKKQLDIVTQKQKEMQDKFCAVSDDGQYIKYLGKDFIVYRNVFWPFEDSMPLVENYQINQGESVLDICTGSGVIAIFSAYKGAKKIVALDSSEDAVRSAKENAEQYGFEEIIDVRLSDMYEALEEDEKFDVITGNLPFRNMKAVDQVESTMWDTNLETQVAFFEGALKHLNPGGRIYLSQANFGAVDEMKRMAEESGFDVKLIGQKIMPSDPREFYAFELTKKW